MELIIKIIGKLFAIITENQTMKSPLFGNLKIN